MSERTVVIGGGHVGLTLYADIKRARPEAEVCVITSAPLRFLLPALQFEDILSGESQEIAVCPADFTLWGGKYSQVL
jgi:NADH dehydrogenase FAD-containing subunit